MALPTRRHSSDPARRGDVGAVRWLPTDPFADFEDIYRRMDQMMRSFGSIDRGGWPQVPVDIEETGDAYVVEIDLPGVARDDVTLEWNDRELTVHGEVKERERTGFLRTQTRRAGQFHHSITLPGEVDGDRIAASLEDGVLTVRVPKADSGRARRIQITSSGQKQLNS
ncbi:heat shock protein Hsp20 [Kribbella flavida DSM 17836]|uniref:Heat shock protein Hsp20 n=1 Tax=Kribbella flavida (strain DSM 17836 / JCM 10339 / NBRC 14399) TaxID=479435 RepID=D2PR88_KRIFD|nr:Hsp20/alpha crystallin family protein [Kribbella flavida]ADB33036.1 heat shock protein Hsp20 [Kribbella flavida DSM 17836]